MLNQTSSKAFINVSSVLSGISLAACHLVHLSNMWKIMCLSTSIRSHSTWVLKVSAISTEHAFAGPGLCHSRQTRQVYTISGMSSNTSLFTPTLSRNLCMVDSEACHHLTCNFLRVGLMAPGCGVLNNLTTPPISKFVQSVGLSGFEP